MKNRDLVAVTESPIAGATLGRFTQARVALGRAGSSLPTAAHLRFVGDHARARDAVWTAVDFAALEEGVAALGLSSCSLRSLAADRATYLRRPDHGRCLDADSETRLVSAAAASPPPRVALVIADGLSAEAVQTNALPLLGALLPLLRADGTSLSMVALVEQGRVAIGDPIGQALGAELVVILIGERPGLSAADSLGCYVTWAPTPGTPDSRRNCVSNIRSGGLAADAAATKIAWLVREALARQVTGVALKENEAETSALIAGN